MSGTWDRLAFAWGARRWMYDLSNPDCFHIAAQDASRIHNSPVPAGYNQSSQMIFFFFLIRSENESELMIGNVFWHFCVSTNWSTCTSTLQLLFIPEMFCLFLMAWCTNEAFIAWCWCSYRVRDIKNNTLPLLPLSVQNRSEDLTATMINTLLSRNIVTFILTIS